MEAILREVRRGRIPARPAVVISDRPEAGGLEIARRLGVSTEVVPSRGFTGSRWEYDQGVIAALKRHKVTGAGGLVCLAGFMRIISPEFVKRYRNRIMNIHPAILPSFPGLNAQRQAVEHGVRFSGCTVHFVDSGVDSGAIIIQSVVEVKGDDTEETLARRILAREHRIYPRAVELFARGRIRVVGRRAVIT